MSPSKDRSKLRSRFYEGIAAEMAMQWGGDARKAVTAASYMNRLESMTCDPVLLGRIADARKVTA